VTVALDVVRDVAMGAILAAVARAVHPLLAQAPLAMATAIVPPMAIAVITDITIPPMDTTITAIMATIITMGTGMGMDVVLVAQNNVGKILVKDVKTAGHVNVFKNVSVKSVMSVPISVPIRVIMCVCNVSVMTVINVNIVGGIVYVILDV
jgi:hypothetical protein